MVPFLSAPARLAISGGCKKFSPSPAYTFYGETFTVQKTQFLAYRTHTYYRYIDIVINQSKFSEIKIKIMLGPTNLLHYGIPVIPLHPLRYFIRAITVSLRALLFPVIS